MSLNNMSRSPKYLANQFMIQKKILLKSNNSKRNKIVLKSNKFFAYAESRRGARKLKPNHKHNKSLNLNKNFEIASQVLSTQGTHKRGAKSLDLRRKDNGNYISSIYPPDQALTRPRRINPAIENELVEFMCENEEKFK